MCKHPQRRVIAGIAARCYLETGTTIRRDPLIDEIAWKIVAGNRVRLEQVAQSVECRLQRLDKRRFGPLACQWIGLRKRNERSGQTVGRVGASTRRGGSKLIERVSR